MAAMLQCKSSVLSAKAYFREIGGQETLTYLAKLIYVAS